VLANATFPEYVSVYVLLNNQQGGFEQVPTSFDALTDQAILVGLNGDGNLDLIVSYVTAAGADVYLGNGQGDVTYQVGLGGPIGILGPSGSERRRHPRYCRVGSRTLRAAGLEGPAGYRSGLLGGGVMVLLNLTK